MMRRTTSLNGNVFGIDGPEFGALLRTHRLRAGLTQQALAELATVSSRTIRDLECGRACARARTVQLLADGLGLTGLTRQAFVEAGRRNSGGPDPATPELDTDPPHSGDPLFGRDNEVRALVQALEMHRRRAITVLGLGGVGKSRTVLEVARQLHQQRKWPVLWVPAGPPLHHAGRGRLITEIRAQLESSSPDLSRVRRLIGEHDALMVLDNLTVAPVIDDLLEDMLGRCPGLRIVVTMRGLTAPLGCQPAIISPLPIPPEDAEAGALADVARVPSVQLLMERLAEIQPGWALTPDDIHAAVVLCRRLDGLPLSLEIASHQCAVLSLRELAALPAADLLQLSAPAASSEATQSIGEVIASSCAMLDETQLSHLRALVTLPAQWTINDVEAELNLPRAEVVSTLVVLTRLGLVRRLHEYQTSVFQVLNLVREFLQLQVSGTAVPG